MGDENRVDATHQPITCLPRPAEDAIVQPRAFLQAPFPRSSVTAAVRGRDDDGITATSSGGKHQKHHRRRCVHYHFHYHGRVCAYWFPPRAPAQAESGVEKQVAAITMCAISRRPQ